jgi:hypothetical protein
MRSFALLAAVIMGGTALPASEIVRPSLVEKNVALIDERAAPLFVYWKDHGGQGDVVTTEFTSKIFSVSLLP